MEIAMIIINKSRYLYKKKETGPKRRRPASCLRIDRRRRRRRKGRQRRHRPVNTIRTAPFSLFYRKSSTCFPFFFGLFFVLKKRI